MKLFLSCLLGVLVGLLFSRVLDVPLWAELSIVVLIALSLYVVFEKTKILNRIAKTFGLGAKN
jgi:uncharacterized membrane protein YfcA